MLAHAARARAEVTAKNPAEGGAGGHKHQAFGEKLAEQARAAAANRETHAELSLPRRVASREQHRDVRASDHEDHPDHREKDVQRLLKTFAAVTHARGRD